MVQNQKKYNPTRHGKDSNNIREHRTLHRDFFEKTDTYVRQHKGSRLHVAGKISGQWHGIVAHNRKWRLRN